MHCIESIKMDASVLFVALLRINLIVRHQSDLNTLLYGDRSQFEAWNICGCLGSLDLTITLYVEKLWTAQPQIFAETSWHSPFFTYLNNLLPQLLEDEERSALTKSFNSLNLIVSIPLCTYNNFF